ncbi:MAG: MBL fold metallo-hydrolase [Spirochaetales bacterium]|jgi:glyoxylase-like metal-dependent hydrolase (beta-lactamase superfamily II)|nr:MBL fold metallo-hydrolase [Spirochaetales bacterium]
MKISKINLGTLCVNAFEMIMGVPEEKIRENYDVDEKNQMRIGMNTLIVENGDRVLIIDPGTATFLPKSLEEEYKMEMDYALEETVKMAGYSMNQITDVLFTHLHFDHGSGAFLRVIGGINKAFPNARYVVSKKQLDSIADLSTEESTSYFHKLLRFAGELKYFEDWAFEGITFHTSHGHTEYMLVPVIDAGDLEILFASDLIPMKLQKEIGAWSYYDKDSELLQKEKEKVFEALRPGFEIVYYHEE